MVEVKELRGTKRIAFALFSQGKRPSSPEVKALGLKYKTAYNYFQLWKKLGKPAYEAPKRTTYEAPKGSPVGSCKEPEKVVFEMDLRVTFWR